MTEQVDWTNSEAVVRAGMPWYEPEAAFHDWQWLREHDTTVIAFEREHNPAHASNRLQNETSSQADAVEGAKAVMDKSEGVKENAPKPAPPPSPLPVSEKFLLSVDDEGDYIIEAQRGNHGQYLAAHGSTLEDAEWRIRQVLDMASPLPAPLPSPSEIINEAQRTSDLMRTFVGIPADQLPDSVASRKRFEDGMETLAQLHAKPLMSPAEAGGEDRQHRHVYDSDVLPMQFGENLPEGVERINSLFCACGHVNHYSTNIGKEMLFAYLSEPWRGWLLQAVQERDQTRAELAAAKEERDGLRLSVGIQKAFILERTKERNELRAQLAEAQKRGDGWISVGERMPETATEYLIAWGTDERCSSTAWWEYGRWCNNSQCEYEVLFDVTHWQTLPAPPAKDVDRG